MYVRAAGGGGGGGGADGCRFRLRRRCGCLRLLCGGRNHFGCRGLGALAAGAAPRRSAYSTPTPGRRTWRTAPGCGRPAEASLNVLGALGIGMPDRLIRRVEHAVAVLLHLKAFGVLAVGARRPHRLAARGQHQVAVVLQRQRVRRRCLRCQRSTFFELLSFAKCVSHVVDPTDQECARILFYALKFKRLANGG